MHQITIPVLCLEVASVVTCHCSPASPAPQGPTSPAPQGPSTYGKVQRGVPFTTVAQ